jgi:ribosomal protein L14E/L6E/L27E
MMLVWQAYKIQKLQGHRGFHRGFQGKPGRPKCVAELESLQAASERVMGEADSEVKMQWRHQEVRDVRNMERLPSKAVSRENWSRREDV